MKRVDIYLNSKEIAENLYVNGKPVLALYSKQFLKYVYSFETELPDVEIEIKNRSYLFNKLYLLMEIVFFLITFFGIFDARKPKGNDLYFFQASFTLNEDVNSIEIFHLNNINLVDGGPFIEIKTNLTYLQNSNIDSVNNEIIRRKKVLRRTKLIIFFSIVLIAITTIVLTTVLGK